MKQADFKYLSDSDRDIIYPIYSNEEVCSKVVETLGFDINEVVDKSFNKVTKVYTLGKYPFKTITFIGLGKKEEITTLKMRNAFETVSKSIDSPSAFNAKSAVTVDIHLNIVVSLFTESYMLATYKEIKVNEEATIRPEVMILADVDVSKSIEYALNLANGINLSRDLGNAPANIMTPKKLNKVAKMLAEKYGLECLTLNKKELDEIGAGGLLSVSYGSKQPPYMICLKYNGANKEDPYTALIGKGLTFDSGGYNIKGNSYGMKYDMCGGADVLGAIDAIAANRIEANVYAIVPASENLINGSAYKPQDVITTLSKKTVEIVSTDAEGRLILCDAITYAQKLGAKKIVDIATLTGACLMALGGVYAGVFANDDNYYQTFEKALKASDEKGWRLPIAPEYLDMIKSNSANLKNSSGKPGGGASVAASFLNEFIDEGTKWIHLDVAGLAHDDSNGASGKMVRTMVKLVEIDG